MSAATGHVGRTVQTCTIWLPGPKALTRKEPLWGKRGPYTHGDTQKGMNAWREAWVIAGRPHVEGPVILEVYIRVQRPAYHRTRAGELNAKGKEFPVPTGFDISNVVKLVEDALKDHAFGDDDLIVALHGRKTWATLNGVPGTEVSISQSL